MLKKIYKVYCQIESVIAGCAFLAIVVLTFLNAVLRQFKMPIIFVDDLSMLLFGWAAFLGADVAFRHCRLVGMDILTSKLNIKVQKILQLVVYVIMICTLVMFVKFGYELAMSNWARTYNTLKISYGWATLSLPVCSIFMIITSFVKIYKTVLHFGDDGFSLRDDIEDPVVEPEEKELSLTDLT